MLKFQFFILVVLILTLVGMRSDNLNSDSILRVGENEGPTVARFLRGSASWQALDLDQLVAEEAGEQDQCQVDELDHQAEEGDQQQVGEHAHQAEAITREVTFTTGGVIYEGAAKNGQRHGRTNFLEIFFSKSGGVYEDSLH